MNADNKDDKKTDELFQAAFEKFQVNPPTTNWEDIEQELDVQMDEDFRKQLQPLQVTPKPHIWDNIKEELPLHPRIRRYFSWMNKIAVVLVIGMLLSILSDQKKIVSSSKSISTDHSNLTTVLQDHSSSTIPPFDEKSEFVFEVSKTSTAGKHPRNFNEQEEAYIKNLLKFILEDDEEIAEHTDSSVVSKSIRAAYPPSSKETLAKATQKDKSNILDLQISIPLIIVENEEEAKRLIQIYDANHAPVKVVE